MASLGDMMVAGVLRAEDVDRASKFYTQVLGLHPLDMGDAAASAGVAMFTAGSGSSFMVYERPGLPAPESTTLGFAVPADKFDETVADLRGKGVTFEEYDVPEMGLKTVDGIADYEGTKSAWFKDTEGNIINIAVM